ncbi:MAG: hypothetical protein L6Q97_00715 [Thermoanaerobaculia bacterium]|nr:hypothetical protein [Thermoanaerobaculia bacterium]
MIQKRPSCYFLIFSALLFLALLGATSCEKKQDDKAWQYFGEASVEQADKAAEARP